PTLQLHYQDLRTGPDIGARRSDYFLEVGSEQDHPAPDVIPSLPFLVESPAPAGTATSTDLLTEFSDSASLDGTLGGAYGAAGPAGTTAATAAAQRATPSPVHGDQGHELARAALAELPTVDGHRGGWSRVVYSVLLVTLAGWGLQFSRA